LAITNPDRNRCWIERDWLDALIPYLTEELWIAFSAGFEVRSAVPSSFLTEARRKPFQLFITEVW
jgi:hypothetical protein